MVVKGKSSKINPVNQPLSASDIGIRGVFRNIAWQLGAVFSGLRRLMSRQWSYSQEGEDRLLLRFFEWSCSGVYVDIGAHHPYRYSNTQLFYERGWSGINIDSMPGSMEYFDATRPRDTNLEVGISRQSGSAEYFMFDDPAYNGFDRELAELRAGNGFKLREVRSMAVRPLREVLSDCIAPEAPIDFMSIDVEGHELEVLQSNDWSVFRPRMLVIELADVAMDQLEDNACTQFLRTMGYRPWGKTFHSFFFVPGERS